MSSFYEINEHGEVVEYNCGRFVHNSNRQPTDYELELLAHCQRLTDENRRLKDLANGAEEFLSTFDERDSDYFEVQGWREEYRELCLSPASTEQEEP